MVTKGINAAYALYRELSESKRKVRREPFRFYTEQFNLFMLDKLFRGEEIVLPERCGRMMFLGKKIIPKIREDGRISGLTPNWKATHELWNKDPKAKEEKKIIFYFNEHTNGVRYSLHWTKKRVFIKNKDFYAFRLTRTNKRLFHQMILNDSIFYIDHYDTGGKKKER